MKLSNVPVTTDPSLPDGRLQGFAADGTLVVEMEFHPIFKYLVGDKNVETCVVEWRISPDHQRRLAAQAAWQMHDYACRKGVQ